MNKVRLFDISIDAVSLQQAAARVAEMASREERPCRYVVTPNVDHVVRLRDSPEFRRAYDEASLVVADGMPIVLAARWLGRDLPERVPGSDLVPALFDHVERSPGNEACRVFLLGAAPGVADRAAVRIEERWKRVRVAGTHSPPIGFERDPGETETILARIETARPHVLLVGLGAPKQELWVLAHRDRVRANVALCIGATIDFLAGERARAPRWMQKSGLEWLHRLGTEPRRLTARYARNAGALPRLLVEEWWNSRHTRG